MASVINHGIAARFSGILSGWLVVSYESKYCCCNLALLTIAPHFSFCDSIVYTSVCISRQYVPVVWLVPFVANPTTCDEALSSKFFKMPLGYGAANPYAEPSSL